MKEKETLRWPDDEYGVAYHEKCSSCARKIAVSIRQHGISHISNIMVTCGECLLKDGINKDWAKGRPEEAKELEDWLKEDTK